MVAPPGAAEAVAGTTASNPVATAMSPTTLHENATPRAANVPHHPRRSARKRSAGDATGAPT
jgi:hypothetical protein